MSSEVEVRAASVSDRLSAPLRSRFRLQRILRSSFVRAAFVAMLVFGALLLAAYWKFGSLAVARAYLQGERLIIEPQSLSFGEAPVNEERELHFRVANWTGKSVQLVGKKSTCRCMVTDSLPLDIGDRQTRQLTIKVGMPAKAGEMIQALTFYSDSDEKPSFVVMIEGNVVE